MFSRRQVNTYNGMFSDILNSVINKNILSGKDINTFENTFSKYIGVKNAIAVSSGRYGMKLLLQAFNAKKGEEVIFPSYTYHALPKIAIDLGLEPVFVDINKSNFGINIELLENRITPKTKFIVATHLFGTGCDIERIVDVAKRHKIRVIEDCAQSLGAESISGKKLGTYGDGAFYSLDTAKLVNTFGGGVVVTNNDEAAKNIREKVNSLEPSLKSIISKLLKNYIELYSLRSPINIIALNLIHNNYFSNIVKKLYRKIKGEIADKQTAFANIQAIVGIKQLNSLNRNIDVRKNIAFEYIDRISEIKTDSVEDENIKYLIKMRDILNDKNIHVFYNFIILIKNTKRISDKLIKCGIDTGYNGQILENCGELYDSSREYPVAKYVVENSLELPMYLNLKEEEIKFIVDKLKDNLTRY